jgi:hypothetical protein
MTSTVSPVGTVSLIFAVLLTFTARVHETSLFAWTKHAQLLKSPLSSGARVSVSLYVRVIAARLQRIAWHS